MAAGGNPDPVLFEQGGVFIHTTQGDSEDVLLGGKVQLVKKFGNEYIEWNPLQTEDNNEPGRVEQPDTDWTVVNTVSYQKDNVGASGESNDKPKESVVVNTQPSRQSHFNVHFKLTDVKTIRKSKPSLGWCYLVFKLKDNVSMPPLHFHEGGSGKLMVELKKYVTIATTPADKRLMVVTPHDADALTQSFSELQILKETSQTYANKFFQDPVTLTMGGFSKVTNFLRDNLLVPQPYSRPANEYAELMPDMSGFTMTLDAEQGYELIMQTKLGPRPEVTRGKPLTQEEWQTHLDKEGRVSNVPELMNKIFQGGLCPSLRADVYKFLLSYYPWDSTTKERIEIHKRKEEEYFVMKAQWRTVTAEQEKRFTKFAENKCIIDKDVIRTDRVHPYYESENNPHLEVLYDILMTYCQYNFDLGYVQGMSDLLSPILLVMDDEVDAFWCFVGYMDHIGVCANFDLEQSGMKNQLVDLNKLLQVTDPKLYSYLQSKECSNLYFVFRWLLIWFKREFNMDNILRLWEVMWTQQPCKNFHLLMCLAILDGETDIMQKEDFGFSDILKHVNDLSCHIDGDTILARAEAIYLQLKEYEDLPHVIKEIIGLSSSETDNGTTETESPTSESSIEVLADPEGELDLNS